MDISKKDKAEVLAALYNNSKVQGLGFLQATNKDMSVEDAKKLLENQTYFDYLYGKVMKIDLSGDSMRTDLYNRDVGEGEAERIVSNLEDR